MRIKKCLHQILCI